MKCWNCMVVERRRKRRKPAMREVHQIIPVQCQVLALQPRKGCVRFTVKLRNIYWVLLCSKKKTN